MREFLEANWLAILSTAIGVLVAYFFYRLQKKDTASAADERKKRAAAELVDVVESYIINKQRVSDLIIDNLITASERDHQVALRPERTSMSLLQDVALRLQRSRHLDIPQKSEYSDKIEQLIKDILEERKTARAQVQSAEPRQAAVRPGRRYAGLISGAIGLAASLATSLIASKLFPDASNSTQTIDANPLVAFGVILACVVVAAALSVILRIRRRSTEGPVPERDS